MLRNIMEADAKMLLLTELLQRGIGGSGTASPGSAQPPSPSGSQSEGR